MLGSIKHTIFRDISVPYGAAFFIQNPIDLEVNSIQLLNLVATNCTYLIDDFVGGSGFIFIGKSFCGSNICADNLSTKFVSAIFAYTEEYEQVINSSSISNSASRSFTITIGKYSCISSGVNITSSISENYVTTIHFGWEPNSYYQENFIGHNNTGMAIFGHSCKDTAEQKCRNIVLVENEASSGILGFWLRNHRLINSYLLYNRGKLFYTFSKNVVLTLDSCYSEDTEGVKVTNSKMVYETTIYVASSVCDIIQRNVIYEEWKKLFNIRTCTNQRRLSYSLFFCLQQTSQEK